jgi:hypothetical protein
LTSFAAGAAAGAAVAGGLFPQSLFSAAGLPSWFNINFISLMTAWGASEVWAEQCVKSVC